jgi:hypothetical protein
MNGMSALRKPTLNYFLYDNNTRQFLELRNGAICGRTEGEFQFATDAIVSRRQCVFKIDKNDIYVEDLGSTNKTRVNSVPIRSNYWRRIQLNDVIEFGNQRLVLTHQSGYQPSNIEDIPRRRPLHGGFQNEDGSFASQLTRVTKRTQLIIGRSDFQKMRIREAVTLAKLRRKIPTGGPLRPINRRKRWLPGFALVAAVGALVGWFGYSRHFFG